jgi:hypothetical protein
MALPRATRGKYNKFFASAFDEERRTSGNLSLRLCVRISFTLEAQRRKEEDAKKQ